MTKPPRTRPDPVEGCLEVCRRCDRVAALCEPARTRDGQPFYPVVGPHLRHCLDHFGCLVRGLRRGRVDYDDRGRDPELETDPTSFRRALAEVVGALEGLSVADLRRPFEVRQMAAPGAASASLPSSLARELAFLSSHTVHHLAIIVEAARGHGLELPDELAVAFSTAAHRESVAAGG